MSRKVVEIPVEVWEFSLQDAEHIAALHRETLRLMNEIARLKAEVERLRNLGIKLDGYVDLLQAENERLRKAGDAVCESPYLWENDPAVIAWRAAKEGKPSV